ncbi:MAG TPA: SRPBCC family protein [Acidothermales bacterium]
MLIQDRFTVNVPIEEAWQVLLDVERVAPCMPGAQLTAVDGDDYHGTCKVKLGAITANFKGTIRFIEVDEAQRRVVLSAKGREARGSGNASATVTAQLREVDANTTEAQIDTDLAVSGKMAQFGRGVMADVSTKIMGEFARRLEESLAESRPDSDIGNAEDEAAETKPAEIPGAGAPAPAGEPQISPETSRVRTVVQTEVAEPVDLMAIAGPSVLRRQGVPVALAGVLALLAITNGRGKRLGLAAVGVALVAASVVAEHRR